MTMDRTAKVMLTAALVFIALSFVVILISIIFPLWLYSSDLDSRIGLFFSCIENSGSSSCSEIEDPDDDWVATQVFIIFGGIFIFMAMCFVVVHIVQRNKGDKKPPNWPLTVITVLLTATSVSLTIGVMIFGISVYNDNEVFSENYDLYVAFYLITVVAMIAGLCSCCIGLSKRDLNKIKDNDPSNETVSNQPYHPSTTTTQPPGLTPSTYSNKPMARPEHLPPIQGNNKGPDEPRTNSGGNYEDPYFVTEPDLADSKKTEPLDYKKGYNKVAPPPTVRKISNNIDF